MPAPLARIYRAALGVWFAICMTAYLLGERAHTHLRPPCHSSGLYLGAPLYRGPSGITYFEAENRLCLTDTAIGAVRRCAVPDLDHFDVLACSPWRDGEGNHQLVVRYLTVEGQGRARKLLEMGVALCTHPAGRVVCRVSLSPPPANRVCWDPERSDRIVYPAGGVLYSYTFPPGATTDVLAAEPEPITWECTPPWPGGVLFRDLCWPTDPAWNGSLIATISRAQYPRRCDDDLQLWTIRLSPDRAQIVAAECLLDLTTTELVDHHARLLFPAAAVSPEGTRLLAFLVHDRRRSDLSLWVMAARASSASRGTSVPPAAAPARRVAVRCHHVEPAFSPDARWLYATVEGNGPCEAQVVRFPVWPEDGGEALALPHEPCPGRPDSIARLGSTPGPSGAGPDFGGGGCVLLRK
jgi:hypothetical protein